MDSQSIYSLVNEKYSQYATHDPSNIQDQEYASNVAQSFGYTAAELHSLPQSANMGLSCGNPIATANLREGEVVVDLGCGGGMDVIFAARKVGKKGKVFGVDRSKAMVDLATKNAEVAGVEETTAFFEAPITAIPVHGGSVDCVISNCVINLVPHEHKASVFGEIYRVLRPGGRVAVSDILAKRELPERIREDAALLVGCVAGASLVAEYRGWLEDAGFRDVLLVDTGKDLNVYNRDVEGLASGDGKRSCCDKSASTKKEEEEEGSAGTQCKTEKASCKAKAVVDLNEWTGSFQIYAVKPVA